MGARRSLLRAEAVTGLVCALGVALAGLPVGLLWAALSPRADVVPVPGGGVDFADSETKAFIAADGALFLLSVVAGVLAALVVWRLVRRREVGAVLGLVVGAGLAAYVAVRTGELGEDRQAFLAAARSGSLPGVTGLPLRLRAQAVLLAWPAAAAVTWTLLLLRSDTGRPVGAGAAPDGAAASAAPDGAAPGRDDPGPGPVSSG